MEKCNHNPNDRTSTLEEIKPNRKTMVKPQFRNFYCTKCGELFIFVKENGNFIEVNK